MSRQKKLKKLRRRRARGLPTRQWITQGHWEDRIPRGFTVTECTITFEPVSSDDGKAESLRRLLGDDQMERLHAMVFENPREAVPELSQLLEQHPEMPILYNWLSVCHGRLGQTEKYEQLIVQNYEQNPNYLFARANYAQLLLGRGELERAAEVFDNTWDLKSLYPYRNEFHVTEFVAFTAVAVEYMMRTGKVESANTLYKAMRQIAPDHEATLQLKKVMESSLLSRALTGLLSLTGGGRRD